MPYTKQNAPDWVKALPAEAMDSWVKAYNAAHKQYNGDEGRAAAVAFSAIRKMGYKRGADDKWHKAKEHAVEFALLELSVFGVGAQPSVDAVTEDAATCRVGDATYSVPYSERDGTFVFGQPVKAEGAPDEPDEQFDAAKESERIAFTVAEDDQHRSSPESGDWSVVIIEEGDNPVKRRSYTARAIESVDPALYEGKPMHLDHAGKEGDNQQARSVKDMAGVVKKAWRAVSESGKRQIRGMVHVFDPWLRERLQDDDFRAMVGLSHVADIAGKVKKVGRVATQVVESIVQPYAVDWVSKAAFGGRVTESEDILTNRSEDLMALSTLTVADLERERPDLVSSISERATKTFQAQALESEAVSDAERKAADAEARAKTAEAELRRVTLRQLATEEVGKPDHKIPDAARPDIVDRVVNRLGSQETPADKLSATVAETVKSEVEFGSKFVSKPAVNAPGGTPPPAPADDLRAKFDSAVGVTAKKQD